MTNCVSDYVKQDTNMPIVHSLQKNSWKISSKKYSDFYSSSPHNQPFIPGLHNSVTRMAKLST